MDQPKIYSRYNDLQTRDNTYVLNNYLDRLEFGENDKIFDVGCGDGRFGVEVLLPTLKGKWGWYTGCDVSKAMVEYANEKYSSNNTIKSKWDKIEFVVFDITADGVPERFREQFHHVFSFYTLHWVQKQRQAFRNIYNLLRPGGDILLCFLAANPIYDIYQSMAKNKKWKMYFKKEYVAPYHNTSDPEKQLHKLLTDTGFKVRVCKVENRSFTYPDLKVWEKSVKAVNPMVARLPEEEVDEYISDFLEEAKKLKTVTVESVNNNDETVVLRYKMFAVYALKPAEKEERI